MAEERRSSHRARISGVRVMYESSSGERVEADAPEDFNRNQIPIVKRKLEGRWLGESVENFDAKEMAAATGWARGLSLEFSGTHLTVAVPADTISAPGTPFHVPAVCELTFAPETDTDRLLVTVTSMFRYDGVPCPASARPPSAARILPASRLWWRSG